MLQTDVSPTPINNFSYSLTQLQIRFPCGASILPAQFSSSSCCRGLVLSRPVLSCHPASTPFAAFLGWIPVSWTSCLSVSWFTPSFCWSISSNTFRKKEHSKVNFLIHYVFESAQWPIYFSPGCTLFYNLCIPRRPGTSRSKDPKMSLLLNCFLDHFKLEELIFSAFKGPHS